MLREVEEVARGSAHVFVIPWGFIKTNDGVKSVVTTDGVVPIGVFLLPCGREGYGKRSLFYEPMWVRHKGLILEVKYNLLTKQPVVIVFSEGATLEEVTFKMKECSEEIQSWVLTRCSVHDRFPYQVASLERKHDRDGNSVERFGFIGD